MQLASVEEAIQDIQDGKFVIVVDDEDRENEGDLTIASDFITPEAVNFMAIHGRGLICMPMAGEMLDNLEIPMMVPPSRNGAGFGTNFTISVEAKEGVSTGISAHDRSRTIEVLGDPESKPGDLVMPGHIFPLRAKPGGVLERTGQTEACVDLAKMAGLTPAGVICEIMSEDGTMARLPELMEFSEKYGIKVVSVESMVQYRKEREGVENVTSESTNAIIRGAETKIPTDFGMFNAVAYLDLEHNEEHLLLYKGDISGGAPLVRLHSSCVTGDVLGSCRCDCGEQLKLALKRIEKEGNGILIYLNQEGRGIGLGNKIKAYRLQDQGMDTVEANEKLGFAADARSYNVASQILKDQKVNAVRLMTNNPSKVEGLSENGISVTERVVHQVKPNSHNIHYLNTKAVKLGHRLSC